MNFNIFIVLCLVGIFLVFRLVIYFKHLQKVYCLLAPISGPNILESLYLIKTFLFKFEPIGTKVNRCARQLCDQFGKSKGIIKLGYGLFPPQVFICNEKLAKKILAHPDFQNKADISRFIGNVLLGNDIFTCTGQLAKVYRQELIKHFFSKSFESYIETFAISLKVLDAKIERLVDSSETKGTLKDIKPTISTLVLDSIGDNFFSMKFNAQSNGEPTFITSLEFLMSEANMLMIEEWKTISNSCVINNFCFLIYAAFWKVPTLFKSIISFKFSMLRLVLQQYWKVYKQKQNSKNGNFCPFSLMETIVHRRISAAFSRGLSLWSPLTFYTEFKEAYWHQSMFMIAGHQTTSMALTWALYYLCKHEQTKQKLQTEVDDFLKDSPPMTKVFTSKSALRYLEAVLRETLRLAPAAPYLGRKAAADVTFSVSSVDSTEEPDQLITIPAGTNVVVMAQYMHYSERYYRDAGSFIPERWLKTEAQNENRKKNSASTPTTSCYFSFSAGNRACFGEKYAMLQMKLTLLSICRKYDFTFAYPDTVCEPSHHLAQRPARFAIKFSRR